MMEDKTMKKTYIKLEMKVVKIATHQMLASSPTVGINSSGEAIDAGFAAGREFEFDDNE